MKFLFKCFSTRDQVLLEYKAFRSSCISLSQLGCFKASELGSVDSKGAVSIFGIQRPALDLVSIGWWFVLTGVRGLARETDTEDDTDCEGCLEDKTVVGRFEGT